MAREQPGVYACSTAQGARYRNNFRDFDGKQSCKRRGRLKTDPLAPVETYPLCDPVCVAQARPERGP